MTMVLLSFYAPGFGPEIHCRDSLVSPKPMCGSLVIRRCVDTGKKLRQMLANGTSQNDSHEGNYGDTVY